uniref:Uncharacterized protein MANES_18G021300 n=1 Tax=Rhizophora mucronata TaxID=61149 RepID=A0A2P2M9G6_RHIMU
MSSEAEEVARRHSAVTDYRKKRLQHKELESRVRAGIREEKPQTSFSFFLSVFFNLFNSSPCYYMDNDFHC